MDFILLYRRIRDIFTNPASMWISVRDENRAVNELRFSFLIPVVLLVAISGFIGAMIYSYNGLSIIYPLIIFLRYLLVFMITVELASWMANEISLVFSPEKSFAKNYKLVLYSFTPFMITMAISRLFPALIFLNIGGLYGVFIAWKGLEILTDTPQQLRIRYLTIITLVTIITYIAISFLVKFLLDGVYYSFT